MHPSIYPLTRSLSPALARDQLVAVLLVLVALASLFFQELQLVVALVIVGLQSISESLLHMPLVETLQSDRRAVFVPIGGLLQQADGLSMAGFLILKKAADLVKLSLALQALSSLRWPFWARRFLLGLLVFASTGFTLFVVVFWLLTR
jgi:hypothetical protein